MDEFLCPGRLADLETVASGAIGVQNAIDVAALSADEAESLVESLVSGLNENEATCCAEQQFVDELYSLTRRVKHEVCSCCAHAL